MEENSSESQSPWYSRASSYIKTIYSSGVGYIKRFGRYVSSWLIYDETRRHKFIVRINEQDYKRMCEWTLMKKNIETGGDLFGLWFDSYTPVVQLVLGPGKKVQRSATSFFQDVEYLENVGSYLTAHEGLCHIGEWHSHHQLNLMRPSMGDENTIWENMPNYGLTKFILFISCIRQTENGVFAAKVNCFLFEIDPSTNQALPVIQGKFELLSVETNPFTNRDNIFSEIMEKDREETQDNNQNLVLHCIPEPDGDEEKMAYWYMEKNINAIDHCTETRRLQRSSVNCNQEVMDGYSRSSSNETSSTLTDTSTTIEKVCDRKEIMETDDTEFDNYSVRENQQPLHDDSGSVSLDEANAPTMETKEQSYSEVDGIFCLSKGDTVSKQEDDTSGQACKSNRNGDKDLVVSTSARSSKTDFSFQGDQSDVPVKTERPLSPRWSDRKDREGESLSGEPQEDNLRKRTQEEEPGAEKLEMATCYGNTRIQAETRL